MNARTRLALSLGLLTMLSLPAAAHGNRKNRAPRIERARHGIEYGARRVWIPAHYETVFESVFVPGCERREWIPARYEYRRLACGRTVRVLVEAGHFHIVREPGRWERQRRSIHVPGHWQFR